MNNQRGNPLIYELSQSGCQEEQLIFEYHPMNHNIIEIAFDALCSQEEVIGFLKVCNMSIVIHSIIYKSYLFRFVIPNSQENIQIIFEKASKTKGCLCLKNIKIKFIDNFPTVNSNVSYIAHRGLSRFYPENTMISFHKAALAGFNKVETDVVTTADGEWVLLHDDTIDRTSNGSGRIGDMTLDEVRRYDFGVSKDRRFLNTSIPTFDEFIQFCAEYKIHPYIEIKKSGDLSKLYKLVDQVNLYQLDVTWISFSMVHLQKISELTMKKHRYGYLAPISDQTIKAVKSLGKKVFIDCDQASVTLKKVEKATQQGVWVESWTVNEVEMVKKLVANGVKGITSDHLNLTGCYF